MNTTLSERMIEATRLTRAGRLMEATAMLRFGEQARPEPRLPIPGGPIIDGVAEPVSAPGKGRFLSLSFTNAAGTRPYKLYVPSGYTGKAVPLIVMLHGCTQSPDDFAAGTRMNLAAERQTFLVAYPGQIRSANPQVCWNWFRGEDQHRDRGEPSLIAGITLDVARSYAVQRDRIYVAGLSAGGAAAAIMADTYPDLYAAAGIHSGLPAGSAHDVGSALMAMKGRSATARHAEVSPRIVPTILFQGDRDTTVDASNADAIVAQLARGHDLACREDSGQKGGYAYRRKKYAAEDGRTMIEQWSVQGAGHAWFGGDKAGSYTDPNGPDATAEMIRFFLSHAHP